MKKKLFSLLCLVLALSMLWACGTTSRDRDDDDDEDDDKGSSLVIPGSDGSGSPSVSIPEDDTPATSGDSKPAQSRDYTFGHTTLTLPEGFSVDESASVPIATHSSYPTVADNITFVTGGADNIDAYTEELISQIYKQQFGDTFSLVTFEKGEMDGVPAIALAYTVTLNGVEMLGIQVMIFGSSFSDVVTFTIISEEYVDIFSDCADTIRVN